MSFTERLDSILKKHQALGDQLANPADIDSKDFPKISKEYSDLGSIVEIINDFKETEQNIAESKEMLEDPEMKEMAEEELEELNAKLPKLEDAIKLALIPKDEADEKNAILEIRAGTGGDEAALFAGNLLNMYQRFAANQGWKFEILNASDSDAGGFKEIVCNISGTSVYSKMKFESGVHRVQRVPDTESSGRIHTSAATVAVLPEAEDVDIDIQDADLRIDVFRASGPGGQSVNTTDSAIRITHIPTGIVVSQQDEKSQHKNRAKAMRILKSRLYDHQRQIVDSERSENRKSQVGSGDRSERIRTYNYPQSRVTDHRVNLTLYKLNEIVNEGGLDEVLEALIAEDQAQKLASED